VRLLSSKGPCITWPLNNGTILTNCYIVLVWKPRRSPAIYAINHIEAFGTLIVCTRRVGDIVEKQFTLHRTTSTKTKNTTRGVETLSATA